MDFWVEHGLGVARDRIVEGCTEHRHSFVVVRSSKLKQKHRQTKGKESKCGRELATNKVGLDLQPTRSD